MKEVKVGVVGAGGIFLYAHLTAYAKIPEARLVAIADISPTALRRAVKRIREVFNSEAQKLKESGEEENAQRLIDIANNVRVYTSHREMLEKEELDLVDVCTPHKFHKPVAIDVLNHGVNVMVEKPMARNFIEALEMMEMVGKTGKLYQHNENWVFTRTFYTLRKVIDTGVIGELQFIYMPSAHGGPEGTPWFWDPDIGGGGALLDMGVHGIGTAWFIAGFDKNPVSVKVDKYNGVTIRQPNRLIGGVYQRLRVEDDAILSIRFKGDDGSEVIVVVNGGWSGKHIPDYAFFGTQGYITLEREGRKRTIVIHDAFGNTNKISFEEDDSFLKEINHMVKCVLRGQKSFLDERKGAYIMAIIDAAYLSEMNGRREVTIKEVEENARKLIQEYGEKASQVFTEMKEKYFSSLPVP